MFSNQQIDLDTLPSIDSVSLKPIAKRYLNIIILNKLALYFAVGLVLFFIKHYVDKSIVQDNFWFITSIAIGGCAINLMVSILGFNRRKYAIREYDIIYAKGLLVHTITTVPINRIQHIETSRSWLERQFKLASLKIFTAGETGGDLTLKGLPRDEAKQINDFISAKVNGNN